MLRWLGLPVEASAHATRIDLIVALVHWLMLAMFVGWMIFFIYVLVRFRRGTDTWVLAYQAAPTADPQVGIEVAKRLLARAS